jgi:exonuclease SbcC
VLSKITANNFLSWKSLEFTVTKGATLIDGWNEDDQRSEGSGKSAILNAICWGIFGKLPKDANVDDVIKDGESSCNVLLEFDNGDSIIRSRKPNDLCLMKAGASIKGKDARETQTFIEEYIGCNFETFCQSVYFAQNYDKKFLASNQEEKGKILSSIQNLQVFDKARKEVMELLKTETDKISKLKNQVQLEESNLNNFISQKSLIESFIQEKIQKHKQQVASLVQQRDMMSGHVKRTQLEIQNVNDKVLAINLEALSKDEADLILAKNQCSTQLAEVSYQKSQIDSVKKSILAKETEGKNLALKYQSIQQKLKSLNPTDTHHYKVLAANLAQVLNEQSPSRLRLAAKAQQLQAFIDNPTKKCPSCGTELKTVDTSHAVDELNSVIKEFEDLKELSKKQASEIEIQMNEEVVRAGNQSQEYAKEASDIILQLQAVEEYLNQNPIPSAEALSTKETEIKTVIGQIDQAIFQTSQLKLEHSKLLNQHSSLTRQLESYVDQQSHYEKALTQLGEPDVAQDSDKLVAIVQEMNTLSVKIAELSNLLNQCILYSQRLESLKDGFKEIKSYVFTNALNELNFRTNHYLSELFDMEASIKFSNDDQKIESKIVIEGHDRSLGLLSGGQNRRFNLAVDLALADIVSYRKTSKLDLLVFDEYFKDLSEISMEKSLNLLKDRKCPVILIEHNSIFKNIVDNTFFVRLENGTSSESRQ